MTAFSKIINYLMTLFSFKGELNSIDYRFRYKYDLIAVTFINLIWCIPCFYFYIVLLDYMFPWMILNIPLWRVILNLGVILFLFSYTLNRCSLTYRRLVFLKKNRNLCLISLLFPFSTFFEQILFSDEQY